MNYRQQVILSGAMVVLLGAGTAFAAGITAAAAPEVKPACQFADNGIPSPSLATSLPAGLADPGGVRAALGKRGVQLGLNYLNDVMGDVKGGIRRGAIYQGRLEFTFDACLNNLIGWPDANFHINFYQSHGTGQSRYYVGNLLPTSYIEALPATRLFEMFIQQKLFDGKVDIRLGQLAADSEFVASQYVNIFMNGSFGWPAITASNLPSGGPAFPLATPGVRVKYQMTESLLLMAGLYNGDPAGPNPANLDPQRRNNRGTNFRLRDKPFAIGEAAWTYRLGDLPGTLKLGAWHHFGTFNDLRAGTDGLSLADPLSKGNPLRHKGNTGYYGIMDQQLWRKPGTDAGNGLAAFVRGFANPGNGNFISYYVDGGLNFKGVIAARPNDAFGIAASFAKVSGRARGFDLDGVAFGGTAPVRDHELGIEISYVAAILDGWTVQPDVQFIFHPGVHGANPRDPAGRPVKDALVLGVRSTLNY